MAHKQISHVQKVCSYTIKYMGGVDRNDQMRSYSSIRLRSNKYYKYLFWALLDVSVTNAIILCMNYTDIKPNTINDLSEPC